MKGHTYTLGIEEEFAIVDPETRQLRSHIQEILEGGKVILKEQIKPEMHQSVVELGTEICSSISHGHPLIYFDNAASSQKPRAVLDAVRHYYEHDNANVHRGLHVQHVPASGDLDVCILR